MSDRHWAAFSQPNEIEEALFELEPSWADFAHGVRTGNRFVRRDGETAAKEIRVKSLLEVQRQLDAFKRRFVEGDPTALVGALDFTISENVPVPYWLADEVQTRFFKVFNEPVSLHRAFGLEEVLPEFGKKSLNARRLLRDRVRIYAEVKLAERAGSKSLSESLSKALASKRFGFGKTVARKLFLEQERIQRQHAGKHDKHR